MRKFIAIVPVRAGSKGFPNKNIQLLEGVPLYLRAAMQGVRTTGGALISTDIEEVLQSNPPNDIKISRRPSQLSDDHTPMESVLKHVIENNNLHDYTLVLLQATSPLRRDTNIQQAIKLYKNRCHDLVMSVVKEDKRILKCGTLEGGRFKAVRDPSYCFQNRQELPDVFAPNGAIYVFSAQDFLANDGFPFENIGVVEMGRRESLDIDKKEDLDLAIALQRNAD